MAYLGYLDIDDLALLAGMTVVSLFESSVGVEVDGVIEGDVEYADWVVWQ